MRLDRERLVFDPPAVAVAANNSEEESQQQSNKQRKKRSGGGMPNRGPVYCRSSSEARRDLQDKLLELYNRTTKSGFDAAVFPSGMCAIGATLTSTISSWKQTPACPEFPIVVYGDELYCDVNRTVRYLQDTQGILGVKINVCDDQQILDTFQRFGKEIRVFHWEGASNPSGQMLDVSLLPRLKKLAPHCVFVCDNTWLSGVTYNPLDYGADIVVESMTKHLSGGTCIGGMALGRRSSVQPVNNYIRVMGIFIDSERCELFSNQLGEGLRQRVSRTAEAALAVAEWLEKDDRVYRIDYPLLPSHRSYKVACKVLKSDKIGPGCLWFQLPVSKSKLLDVVGVEETTPIEFKTSFGGPNSRVDPWPKAEDIQVEGKEKPIPGVWVRLALGYEESGEQTIAKLEALFNRLGVASP